MPDILVSGALVGEIASMEPSDIADYSPAHLVRRLSAFARKFRLIVRVMAIFVKHLGGFADDLAALPDDLETPVGNT